MLLDLKFSIGTLGVGSAAFIAGLYGMNLKNFFEESNVGFLGVLAVSVICAAAVWKSGSKKLRQVQRHSMWDEEGSTSRGQGTDIHSSLPALPGESRVKRQRRLELARIESGEDGARVSEGLIEEKPVKEK